MDFKEHKASCPECQTSLYPCVIGMSLLPRLAIQDIPAMLTSNPSEQLDIEWAVLSFLNPKEQL